MDDIGSIGSFIQACFINNLQVCDDLIDYFNDHPEKHIVGEVGDPDTFHSGVLKHIKDSTDLVFAPNEDVIAWEMYRQELEACIDLYIKKFPYVSRTGEWGFFELTNIQHYSPGGGYKAWHSERVCSVYPYYLRHLVFMTYLNDVNDQGETEFLHQKVKIKPQKGLTLIWPADWTHCHRGIVSPSEHKYIITGWLSFLPANELNDRNRD